MSVWLQKTTVVLFSCTYYVHIPVKFVVFAVFKTHLRPVGSRDFQWMNHMHVFFQTFIASTFMNKYDKTENQTNKLTIVFV